MWQLAVIKEQPAYVYGSIPEVRGKLLWVKMELPKFNWTATVRGTGEHICIPRAVVTNIDPGPGYENTVWHLDSLELLGIFSKGEELIQFEEWLTETAQQRLRLLLNH